MCIPGAQVMQAQDGFTHSLPWGDMRTFAAWAAAVTRQSVSGGAEVSQRLLALTRTHGHLRVPRLLTCDAFWPVECGQPVAGLAPKMSHTITPVCASVPVAESKGS